MKTKIKMLAPTSGDFTWKEGETGYIDGYVRGGDDRPYAAVILGKRLIYASFYEFEVISEGTG